MEIEKIAISKVKPNSSNPRIIKDYKFKKLVSSIKEFPQMLKIRPIVVDESMIVLGGNMRLKACKEAGLKHVYVIKASELSEEQKAEFIIKDNVGFGQWDWDILANEWEAEKLEEWGLDLPIWEDNMTNDEEYKGMNPEQELEDFMNSELKRMYLVYDSDTFKNVVDWFNNKMQEFELEDFSQVVLKLIENDKN